MGACITGCGKALPGLVVTNESLEKLVDTSDEWIFSRTGIKERRISVNETGLDLAEAASRKALGLTSDFGNEVNIESSGRPIKALDPKDIDLLIYTTITPDSLVPSAAAALRKRLGADRAIAFDVNAACTGFIYGLSLAESMMSSSNNPSACHSKTKPIKHALIVSSERLSRLTDWQDRNTCVLFGDGAGAVSLEWSDEDINVVSMYLENTDDITNALTCMQSYSSPLPFDENGVVFDEEAMQKHRQDYPDPKKVNYSYINSLGLSCDPAKPRIFKEFDVERSDGKPDQSIYMNGQKVFKFASKAIENAVVEAASLAGISIDDIDLVVPHQANYRILEYASKRLNIPLDKFQISISKTGNSSSSCLPMALSDAFLEGRISNGSIVCLVAFGGGLTSGATILRF